MPRNFNNEPDLHDDEHEAHHLGLGADLQRMNALSLQRRRALAWLAGAGVLGLTGCGGGGGTGSASSTSTSTSTSTSGTTTGTTGTTTTTTTATASTPVSNCSVIPEETAGPYPGDGSNSASSGIANALALSGIVRSDIRSSVGGASGTAGGVPLTVKLRLVNTNGSCADLSGYAVYLWHCTRDGLYSMYSSGVTAENFLRGVQPTDAGGVATFTTIYPGCYSGRVPHVHFEIYRSSSTATAYGNKLKTSQLTFPTDISTALYAATAGYEASVRNNAAITAATDNVFSDGATLQTASVTGNATDGYVATLTVGISV